MTPPISPLWAVPFRNLDKRMRSLSDRNLVELIEQVQVFREQRSRVRTLVE